MCLSQHSSNTHIFDDTHASHLFVSPIYNLQVVQTQQTHGLQMHVANGSQNPSHENHGGLAENHGSGNLPAYLGLDMHIDNDHSLGHFPGASQHGAFNPM